MDAKFYMDSKFFRRSSTPTPNNNKVTRRRGSESEATCMTGSANVKQNLKRRGSVNIEINDRSLVNKELRKKRHPSGGDNPASPRRNSVKQPSWGDNPSSPRRNSSVFDFDKFVISARVIPEVN